MPNLFFRTAVAPYRVDTYNALHEKGNFELYFFSNRDNSQNFDMEKIYSQCSFKPHFLNVISFAKDKFLLCKGLGRIIKENHPEVIIVPEYKPLTVQVLIYRWMHRGKFKVVSMCDDSYDMVANGNDFSRFHTFARKVVAPRLDDILLVDTKVVDWYEKKYGKGIWLPIIRKEEKERILYEKALSVSASFRDRFGLHDTKVLLFVGRFVDLKNVARVIRAISLCKEDFVFVLVGSGPEEQNWVNLANDCNHKVLFAGRYEGDEVRAWYNVADAFILPSYREAYGAVTNEALLAGCCCAVSSHCGSSCLIDSENGVVFDPFDEQAIASAIDRILVMNNDAAADGVRRSLMKYHFDSILDNVLESLKYGKDNNK